MNALRFLKHVLVAALLPALFLPGMGPCVPVGAKTGMNPFFPLDNGVGRGVWTPEQQAATLEELGYVGIGYNYTSPEDLERWLKELDQRRLNLFEIYFGVNIDKPGVYPAGIQEAIRILKGRETILWLTVSGSTRAGDRDAEAAGLIQQVADWGKGSGLRLALYPHFGMYVATAEDALRVLRKVNRNNVGVTVNLCHELMSGNGERLFEIVKKAAPHTMLATICGADYGPGIKPDWSNYIKPLGQGHYDVYAFVKALRDAGHHGPIGLQCYQLKGDIKENLRSSLAAWNQYTARLAADSK